MLLEFEVQSFKLYNTIHYWNISTKKQLLNRHRKDNAAVAWKDTASVRKTVNEIYGVFEKVLNIAKLKESHKPEMIQSIRFEARVAWRRGDADGEPFNSGTPGIFYKGAYGELNVHSRMVLERLLDLALAVVWSNNNDERKGVFNSCSLKTMTDIRDHFVMVGLPLSAIKKEATKTNKKILDANSAYEKYSSLPKFWQNAMKINLLKYEIECGCSSITNISLVRKYLSWEFDHVMESFVSQDKIYMELAILYDDERCTDAQRWALVRHFISKGGGSACGGGSKAKGHTSIRMNDRKGKPLNFGSDGVNKSLRNLAVVFKTHEVHKEKDEVWSKDTNGCCSVETVNVSGKPPVYIKRYKDKILKRNVMGPGNMHEVFQPGQSTEVGKYYWRDVVEYFENQYKVGAICFNQITLILP